MYLVIFAGISVLLFRIPLKSLKSGWIPISLFLLFTFISNLLFQHGKIVYSVGPVTITKEGLTLASIRTMRVFFMIAGAKILTATTPVESLVDGMGKILRPFEKFGIPVSDFISTMALTMKTLPRLKDHIGEIYREKKKEGKIRGFWDKAKLISIIMMPLFVKSIQSPESFFEQNNVRGDIKGSSHGH